MTFPFAKSSLRRSKKQRSLRAGFSLIEVILATAILMGSVIVLARLAGMGRTQADKAALQSQSQQLCENTMNELLLGLRPLEMVQAEPLLPAESEISDEFDNFASGEESFSDLGGMNEIGSLSAGRDELYGQAGADENLETESEWLYSVRLEPVDFSGSFTETEEFESTSQGNLQKLTVVVVQSDEELQRPVRFTLTRWVRITQVSSQEELGTSFGSGFGEGQ